MLLVCAAVAVVLFAVLLSVAAWYLRRAEPILKATLIEALEQKLHGQVELDRLSLGVLNSHLDAADFFNGQVFHGGMLASIAVEGRGLRIWLPGAQPNASVGTVPEWLREPWVKVDGFSLRVSWRIKLGSIGQQAIPGVVQANAQTNAQMNAQSTAPILVDQLRVYGVHVLLPPKSDRPRITDPHAYEAGGSSGSALGHAVTPRVVVKQIVVDAMDLVLEHSESQPRPPAGNVTNGGGQSHPPLDFVLQHLVMTPRESDSMVAFDAQLVNPPPFGSIHTTGMAGPWSAVEETNAEGQPRLDPGALPITGDFTLSEVDLSSIPGISGHVHGNGKFAGIMREVTVDGLATTQDLSLERAQPGGAMALTTRFHAMVDGTSGDTVLDPVELTTGNSTLVARGKVLRTPDGHGQDVSLDLSVEHGQMEDFLRHVTPGGAMMSGDLGLKAHVELPPTSAADVRAVPERIVVKGHTEVTDAVFNDPKTQAAIKQLSLRGQGKPGDLADTRATTVKSKLSTDFTLVDGVLTVPNLEMNVPGAEVTEHGTYVLSSGVLNFAGEAKMQARMSAMVGGWKGMLLKPADRLLSKDGSGTVVPVLVTGTRADPKIRVDWGRLGH